MLAKPLIRCPECHELKLVKLISGGAAVIVRGTETPCRGNRGGKTPKRQQMNPRNSDKLGRGKNNSETPFWRDGPVNKKVLRNPEKYIREGKVD